MSEIIITTISKTEIQNLIEGAVKKAIVQKTSTDKSQSNTFLDVNQAAAFIGIAKATLYGKCSDQSIPHFKKGKKLYFDEKELITWLKSGKRNTIQDIKNQVNHQLAEKGKQMNFGM